MNSLPFGSAARLGAGRPTPYNVHVNGPRAVEHSVHGRLGSRQTRQGEKQFELETRARGRTPGRGEFARAEPARERSEDRDVKEIRRRDFAKDSENVRDDGDLEAGRQGLRRHETGSSTSTNDGLERPKMNVQIALVVLFAATGLTCKPASMRRMRSLLTV